MSMVVEYISQKEAEIVALKKKVEVLESGGTAAEAETAGATAFFGY
jgi:hypothetical protein